MHKDFDADLICREHGALVKSLCCRHHGGNHFFTYYVEKHPERGHCKGCYEEDHVICSNFIPDTLEGREFLASKHPEVETYLKDYVEGLI